MKDFTPKEAYAFLQAHPDALLIDVRSEIEYLFVGHPVGAIHVSWNDGPDWEINPHFVGEVKKLAGNGGERPVLLICRSGNRSEKAGEALEAAGFSLTARDGVLVVQPASQLTPEQLAACRRFKWHLLAIVGEHLEVIH